MKEIESQASAALRTVLEKIPILRVKNIQGDQPSSDWTPDLVAWVVVGGHEHLLICEVKSNGQPRYARSAVAELRNYIAHRATEATPIFIAPYVSPAVREMCEANEVSYLDLEGNARIAFDGVFIERMMNEKPVTEQRELKSLFKPKSAQVLRAMLREPDRAWKVTELSEASGVSLGHVSNVRNGLINREWASASDDGLILTKQDALLDAWRNSYTAPQGERLPFYTPLHGGAFENAARNVLRANDGPGLAAFASFSAAHWIAPYGRTGTQYFIADKDGLNKLRDALKLTSAAKGENVSVLVPKDEGLLIDTIEPAPGAICTSPIQTYLDLSVAGERGVEAAEHLRQERLKWPK
ncbi:hypothetical protein YK56LOC_69540 [Caballeronia sp. HLA56]